MSAGNNRGHTYARSTPQATYHFPSPLHRHTHACLSRTGSEILANNSDSSAPLTNASKQGYPPNAPLLAWDGIRTTRLTIVVRRHSWIFRATAFPSITTRAASAFTTDHVRVPPQPTLTGNMVSGTFDRVRQNGPAFFPAGGGEA